MNEAEPDISETFDIRTANEWLKAAKKRPVPKMLFDEFWLEGELAILFADTGKGKSLLAVQIAESIARGKSIQPLQMTAPRQTVLYLDFELSDKQFEMRYAAEHEPEKGDFLKHHFRFSDRFKRIEIKMDALLSNESRSFEAFLRHLIEPLVMATGAKVLIIDNITYLKRTAESTRESAPLMKELKRLKKELGLSILVIAHTPKRDTSRPIVVNDLQGSKILSNFADNIFAIGQSKFDAATRYIKHIKPRSTELIYGAAHVPTFRITKLGGNFLGFEYLNFASEAAHLDESSGEREWEKIERIKQMTEENMTIRQIAAELGMSKSTVHRMLKMWQPTAEAESFAEAAAFDPKTHPSYFPGCGEYDDAKDDPRFEGIYDHDDADRHLLRRESYLIEAARAHARSEYNRTGQTPPLAADPAYSDFIKLMSAPPQISEECVDPEPFEPSIEPGNDSLSTFDSPLSVRLDGYGREIFVESDDPNGKPMVWYNYDSKGIKFRHERKGFSIVGARVEDC